MSEFEKFLETKDKVKLYWRGWESETDVKGSICLIHGLGEHCNRYEDIAKYFNKEGFNLFAFDLRGHGQSQGVRGDSPTFDQLLDDIGIFLNASLNLATGLPGFIYGHSLGGNLALNYLLRRKPKIAGAIVSAPALRLAFEPSRIKMILGRTLSKVLPTMAISSGLDTKALSRDSDVIKAYENDPLVHDRVTGRMFYGFMDSGEWAIDHASELSIPTLLMHGSKDRLTSSEASREFAKRAGDICEFVLWDGFYHELHNELDKALVYKYVLNWANKIIDK